MTTSSYMVCSTFFFSDDFFGVFCFFSGFTICTGASTLIVDSTFTGAATLIEASTFFFYTS